MPFRKFVDLARLESRFPVRTRFAGFALLLILLVPLRVLAGEVALEGQWRLASASETAADVRLDDPRLQAFVPSRFTSMAGPGEQAWIVLRPRSGDWPPPPWVLSVMNSGLQEITLYLPGVPPRSAQLGARGPGTWPAHGRLAFAVDTPLAPAEALLLRLDTQGAIAAPPRFTAQAVPDFIASDSAWLALASASLGIMLAMAIMALCFALRLRDATYLHYAVFILGYAFILALQGGFVFEPLGWTALAASPRLWGRLAVVVSIIGAALFLSRFANLRRYLERGRQLLNAYAALVAVVAATGFVPGLEGIGRELVNPLLIVGAPLFIGIAGIAAWRGSRYAGLFMLGWTPLLAVTALGSLQLYGVTRDWAWTDGASLACGALEALLFSLALAYRTLELRRAHAQARLQADIDALTGLLNRRAWHERVGATGAFGSDGGPLSVLFLDLDHFKQLNDRRGHHVGDDTLRALSRAIGGELRKTDIAGRYGGEEFVVALAGTGPEQAMHIADRIRRRLLRHVDDDGPVSTVSIGIATRLPGEDLAMLLRRADHAMYAAKTEGRNRVALAPTNRAPVGA
jgi:diguanylate cyclase (GGDEF)-like protein